VVQLEAANPHFIRCIKPNGQKKSDLFDPALVITQLRYTGLLETVRIRRAGFPLRLPQVAFIARFYFLAELKGFHLKSTLANDKECDQNKANCLAIFTAHSIETKFFQVGKTRVFLKYDLSLLFICMTSSPTVLLVLFFSLTERRPSQSWRDCVKSSWQRKPPRSRRFSECIFAARSSSD